MYFVFIALISSSFVYVSSPAWIMVMTVILFTVLLSRGNWFNSNRLIPYAMIAVSVVVIVINDLSVLDVVSRTKPFTLTILMIISVTLISSLINSDSILNLYRRFSACFKSTGGSNVMMYSSALVSPFLNMATPVIYGKMFKGDKSQSNQLAANIVKRGMMVSMLVAPTFAPIALVIGSHPDIAWDKTILYSIPLVVMTMLFFSAFKQEMPDMDITNKNDAVNSGVGWIAVYIGLLFSLMMVLQIGVVVSIIFSALLTVILAIVFGRDNTANNYFKRVNAKSRDMLNKINNEALIFVSSGILLVSITDIVQSNALLYDYSKNLDGFIIVPLILLVLPLVSMVKLHPIIGFTLLHPLVYLNSDLLLVQKYMLWVCYWVISLQISPISVINITTSNAFGLSIGSITTLRGFMKVYFLAVVYSLLIIMYGEI